MLTVPPNELCATIHDRMPLIMPEAESLRWMDLATPLEAVAPLLMPYPAEEMECYAVSTLVNSPKNISADCVHPI